VSGLREKIADAIAGAVSQDDRYLEHADAVLRVLADHGDTQQVREQVAQTLWDFEVAATKGSAAQFLDAVMAVVAPHLAARDAAVERAERLEADNRALAVRDPDVRTVYAVEAGRFEAEADLAAAQQQLDQVRDVPRFRAYDSYGEPIGDAVAINDLLGILGAPARPAGHDESRQ
jgi:hypothetical protein